MATSRQAAKLSRTGADCASCKLDSRLPQPPETAWLGLCLLCAAAGRLTWQTQMKQLTSECVCAGCCTRSRGSTTHMQREQPGSGRRRAHRPLQLRRRTTTLLSLQGRQRQELSQTAATIEALGAACVQSRLGLTEYLISQVQWSVRMTQCQHLSGSEALVQEMRQKQQPRCLTCCSSREPA